ncbi:MAG: hypothetical protein ACMUHB_02390 [Thermoplasmatota archaeon]
MALSPIEPRNRKSKEDRDDRGPRIPWVNWIAITLGVFLTLMGTMVLLWGFAWQTGVGEPQNIDGEELTGNSCLKPVGAVAVTLGILWLLTGWRGFKKVRLEEGTKPCPYCGKMVETDLTFCYYCNRSFIKDGTESESDQKDKPQRLENDFIEEPKKQDESGTRRARSLDPERKD